MTDDFATRAPSAERPGWEVGATVFDDFRVCRDLGSGGFGRVALVENRRSGQRYAAKVTLAADPAAVSRFLLEAQRWIELPPHPNLVECHFVRAVDDGVAVFSEYIEGGSLADAIASGRLYDGTSVEPPAAKLLGLAIGAARGLQAAHRRGLLHLDVKPANVLIADEGVAKLGDFGLAAGEVLDAEVRAQLEAVVEHIVDVPGADPRERDLMVDALRRQLFEPKADRPFTVAGDEGISIAYASPEQRDGAPLTVTTDVWSWAATVLEMFAGARTWPTGPDAGLALESFVGGHTPPRVVLPGPALEVLRACLRTDPAARPQSLGDVADRLSGGARTPTMTSIAEDIAPSPIGLGWRASGSDPRAWLQLAYETAGLDGRDAARFWPTRLGTRKGRALEDLRALEEAWRRLEPIADTDVLTLQLGQLRVDIGRVRETLDDRSAAADDYMTARRLFASVRDERARLDEAGVFASLARIRCAEGRIAEALAASAAAVGICRSLDPPQPAALASALLTHANADQAAEDRLALLEEAATLAQAAGDDELLARVAAERATVLSSAGSPDAADAWTHADTLLDRLAHAGRPALMLLKGKTSLNRAELAEDLTDQLRHASAAIEMLEAVLDQPGIDAGPESLGHALFLAGQAEEHLDRPHLALERFAASAAHLERAVVVDGRADLADEYARSIDHQATLMRVFGDPAGAVRSGRQAVERWERLTALEGEAEWGHRLADARIKLAAHLQANGEREAALVEINEAMRLLERGEKR